MDHSPNEMIKRGRELKFLEPIKELAQKRAVVLGELGDLEEMLADIGADSGTQDLELRDIALDEQAVTRACASTACRLWLRVVKPGISALFCPHT